MNGCTWTGRRAANNLGGYYCWRVGRVGPFAALHAHTSARVSGSRVGCHAGVRGRVSCEKKQVRIKGGLRGGACHDAQSPDLGGVGGPVGVRAQGVRTNETSHTHAPLGTPRPLCWTPFHSSTADAVSGHPAFSSSSSPRRPTNEDSHVSAFPPPPPPGLRPFPYLPINLHSFLITLQVLY